MQHVLSLNTFINVLKLLLSNRLKGQRHCETTVVMSSHHILLNNFKIFVSLWLSSTGHRSCGSAQVNISMLNVFALFCSFWIEAFFSEQLTCYLRFIFEEQYAGFPTNLSTLLLIRGRRLLHEALAGGCITVRHDWTSLISLSENPKQGKQ